MELVITEKNDAARQIARLLSDAGAPKQDKVYNTPIYRFSYNGKEAVCIGLRGHIMAPDFPTQLTFDKNEGWYAINSEEEHLPADLPDGLARPPYESKRKPYLKDGIDIKGWKVDSLPYLVWAPIEKLPAEKEIIRALKNLAKKADSVVIATDFDREGELIGSDALRQVLGVAPSLSVSRARYSAFTKAEIDKAFSHRVPLDQNLADAGESRQYIDLLWGAVLTRYLTMARFGGFGNVRSAGRVQTPTLGLVVERERQRKAFVPRDYWIVSAHAKCSDDSVDNAFQITHTTARFWDEAQAIEVFNHVKNQTHAHISDVICKSRSQQPPAPFNTTSLQAAAAQEGISPARTMRLAESLYMDGLISYPRVDNTVYPDSLDLKACVASLKSVPVYRAVCTQLLKQPTLKATRGKQQTTDHPPIYPTAPADPDKLQGPVWKLYNLIARRFLATLMDAAVMENTKLLLDVGKESFAASGTVLVKAGFREIYPYGLRKDEQLPKLKKGDVVDVFDFEKTHKQTEPPARYSQGKLIQEMEKLGLGTKSTRASIIQRLYDVKYLKGDPVEPSQLGMAIIEALHTYAPRITTADMTCELEEDMTKVSLGKDTQLDVVDHSRALLAGIMDELIKHKEDLGEAIADAVTADAKVGVCPKCGKDLVMKSSAKTRGNFIGCMGWPECTLTYPVPTGRIEPLEGDAARCPLCGAPRIKVHPFRQRPYECCVNPACPSNTEPDLVVGSCPECAKQGKQAALIAHKSEKTGKRFIRCENFEECQTSYPLPQRGKLKATSKVCPECGSPLVIVETQRGPWKICVNMECPSKKKTTAKKAPSRYRRGVKSRKKG